MVKNSINKQTTCASLRERNASEYVSHQQRERNGKYVLKKDMGLVRNFNNSKSQDANKNRLPTTKDSSANRPHTEVKFANSKIDARHRKQTDNFGTSEMTTTNDRQDIKEKKKQNKDWEDVSNVDQLMELEDGDTFEEITTKFNSLVKEAINEGILILRNDKEVSRLGCKIKQELLNRVINQVRISEYRYDIILRLESHISFIGQIKKISENFKQLINTIDNRRLEDLIYNNLKVTNKNDTNNTVAITDDDIDRMNKINYGRMINIGITDFCMNRDKLSRTDNIDEMFKDLSEYLYSYLTIENFLIYEGLIRGESDKDYTIDEDTVKNQVGIEVITVNQNKKIKQTDMLNVPQKIIDLSTNIITIQFIMIFYRWVFKADFDANKHLIKRTYNFLDGIYIVINDLLMHTILQIKVEIVWILGTMFLIFFTIKSVRKVTKDGINARFWITILIILYYGLKLLTIFLDSIKELLIVIYKDYEMHTLSSTAFMISSNVFTIAVIIFSSKTIYSQVKPIFKYRKTIIEAVEEIMMTTKSYFCRHTLCYLCNMALYTEQMEKTYDQTMRLYLTMQIDDPIAKKLNNSLNDLRISDKDENKSKQIRILFKIALRSDTIARVRFHFKQQIRMVTQIYKGEFGIFNVISKKHGEKRKVIRIFNIQLQDKMIEQIDRKKNIKILIDKEDTDYTEIYQLTTYSFSRCDFTFIKKCEEQNKRQIQDDWKTSNKILRLIKDDGEIEQVIDDITLRKDTDIWQDIFYSFYVMMICFTIYNYDGI